MESKLEHCLEGLDFSGNDNHHWFAVHVRSNFERTTSRILEGKGFQVFLPAYRARRRWTDRVKEEERALFPGYLFCRFNSLNRLPILSSAGVVRIVGMGNSPQPVDPDELQAIWRITHSEVGANPWPHVETGETVVIESGPLTGLEGILKECKGDRRLIVTVTLLQRSVAVEIDGQSVRPSGGVCRLMGRWLGMDAQLRKGPGSASPTATIRAAI
jgi:transcription antitermination factor NusG